MWGGGKGINVKKMHEGRMRYDLTLGKERIGKKYKSQWFLSRSHYGKIKKQTKKSHGFTELSTNLSVFLSLSFSFIFRR